jgi:hypothetical protein
MTQKAPTPLQNPEKPRGLVCPYYGCQHSAVVYPKRLPNGVPMQRGGSRHSGTRFTTRESATD